MCRRRADGDAEAVDGLAGAVGEAQRLEQVEGLGRAAMCGEKRYEFRMSSVVIIVIRKWVYRESFAPRARRFLGIVWNC